MVAVAREWCAYLLQLYYSSLLLLQVFLHGAMRRRSAILEHMPTSM
jgi:hypothetical protein